MNSLYMYKKKKKDYNSSNMMGSRSVVRQSALEPTINYDGFWPNALLTANSAQLVYLELFSVRWLNKI